MRSALFSWAIVAALGGAAQPCFRVVDASSGQALPGALVICADGTPIGLADSTGRICLTTSCERLRVRSPGHAAIELNASVALALGTVALDPEAAELAPAVVQPWPGPAERRSLAAASTLDSARVRGFERASLRSAALFVPGVQWDQRGHGGSQRLSMRGSLLRSVFGVRGVKVYWGPFPLTLADGSTPLEVLDPLLVGTMDVVRSVGAPVYGSAPSGLLLAQAPEAPDSVDRAELEAVGGPYGFFRLSALACSSTKAGSLAAGVLRQRSDGYRDQEWSARDQAFIASTMRHKRGISRLFLTWQNARWALPGSLDSLTAINAPRSARPYSILINAHLDKQQVLAGLAHDARLARGVRLRSALHAQFIDKRNPYGTSAAFCGFKEETIRATGGRIALDGSRRWTNVELAWEAGLEALFEQDGWVERTYVNGNIGDLKIDAATRVTNVNAFASTALRIASRTTLTAAAALERTGYDHNDHLVRLQQQQFTQLRILPCIGVEHALPRGWRMHARHAQAVSRATVWELLGTGGVFNTALGGEQVQEWQAGVQREPGGRRFHGAVHVYQRSTEGLIAEVAAPNGTDREFRNSGDALQTGAEAELHFTGTMAKAWRAEGTLVGSVQRSRIRTDTAEVPHIPGIEPWSIGLLGAVRHRSGARFEVGLRINGAVPPTFAEAPVVPGARVVHLRLSLARGSRTDGFEVFVHAENLLDARYTSWVQVNDATGRYYNPAPGRSFFAGLRLTIGSPARRRAD